jgi:hypothetical protein
MMKVVMLSFVRLSVVRLNVVRLNVVMLSVMAPLKVLGRQPIQLFVSFCRRHDTQHNDIQHNVTQHKGLVCDTHHKRQSA